MEFVRQSINADDAKLLTKSLKEAPRVPCGKIAMDSVNGTAFLNIFP
jgi:hypothetical protein